MILSKVLQIIQSHKAPLCNSRKKLSKLVIIIFLFIVNTSFGQIFNPSFTIRANLNCDLTKIERTSSSVTVYYKFISPYGRDGWACAGEDFFIRDNLTQMKYKLIKVNNIPICPLKYKFYFQGETLEFNLVFEALPESTSNIDIIENVLNGGFSFYGVALQNAPKAIFSSNKSTIITSDLTSSDDCDKIEYKPGTSKPSFANMLAGIKNAIITGKPVINGDLPAYEAVYEYLQKMGLKVEYFSDNFKPSQYYCEDISVTIYYDYDFEKFDNIKLLFTSPCLGYTWELSATKVVTSGLYNATKNDFYKALQDMYPYQKPLFNSSYRIELPKYQTCWNEAKFKSDILVKGCDKLEGIYEKAESVADEPKYKVAVKKINGIYNLIYFSGAENTGDWTEGEIKATLEETATSLLYKAKWIQAGKIENNDFYISFENGLMNVLNGQIEKHLYIKLFPTASDNVNTPSEISGSGTGYAISSNGFIVTNHHVISDATSIKVRGINGDLSKSFSAKVVIDDKNNDLSIIKIEDPSFTTLGAIPYVIASRASDVGTSIFVLGYPLRATMGDEVKLTNGIISSKSGFQGDVTSYQVTAPIQPGNSGGPLFDQNGNIIGIINAKHIGAENVSYAVKSSYLINLIDLMPLRPKLQTISMVAGKSLTEQIKILKKFTYILEIN